MKAILALIVCLACAGATQAQTVTVYDNDFEDTVGTEWSNTSTSVTPIGGRRFLGEFGNGTTSLRLSDLVPHYSLTLSFDLFIIRTWDGNDTQYWDGPDIWDLSITDGPTMLHTTFTQYNPVDPGTRQAYPGWYPSGDYESCTGAAEVNTLGYYSGSLPLDSVYRLSYTFDHVDSTVEFRFSGISLQQLSDESWGLDNVEVLIEPVPEPSALLAVMCGLGYLAYVRTKGCSSHSASRNTKRG